MPRSGINYKYDNLTIFRQGWRNAREFAQFVQSRLASKSFVRAGTKAAAYIASKPGKSLIPHAGT
jgi:hypothetical protein